MENVPLNEKLTLFLYYYFQQLMENQNVPIKMWNINNHRLRTNKATKELQTKHHYRKATVQCVSAGTGSKRRSRVGILKSKEPRDIGQKRRKTCVKDKIIKYL